MGVHTLDISQRTFKFGVEIVKLSFELPRNSAGFAISGQIIRSGTSVGANTEEAQNASSKKEFIRCLTIALKEAREAMYWLKLIKEVGLLSEEKLVKLLQENLELVKILTAIVKNSKLKK